ncbi:unnamed protein product [Caretta caretta]
MKSCRQCGLPMRGGYLADLASGPHQEELKGEMLRVDLWNISGEVKNYTSQCAPERHALCRDVQGLGQGSCFVLDLYKELIPALNTLTGVETPVKASWGAPGGSISFPSLHDDRGLGSSLPFSL